VETNHRRVLVTTLSALMVALFCDIHINNHVTTGIGNFKAKHQNLKIAISLKL